MVGTTDEFCDASHNVEPSQEEIDFICDEIKPFLGEDYDFKNNLLSAWAGLRPLVKESSKDKKADATTGASSLSEKFTNLFQKNLRWLAFKINGSKKKSSGAISRNHVIEVTPSGLVSLMGGKWTSFRSQGEETVDLILKDNPNMFEEVLKYKEG